MGKIDEMEAFAKQLQDEQHYDAQNIATKCQAVLERWEYRTKEALQAGQVFCF